jgi:hypothetical protein
MTETLPARLRLTMVVGPDVGIGALWRFVHEALVARAGFVPDFWRLTADLEEAETPAGGKRRGAPPAEPPDGVAEDRLRRGFAVQGRDGGLTVTPLAPVDAEDPNLAFGLGEGWRLSDVNGRAASAEEVRRTLALYAGLLAAAAARFALVRAEVRRESDSYLGPEPPLAGPEVVVLLAYGAEVAMAYPDPDAFWRVWDRVEAVPGDRLICTRALDVADETAFKARVLRDGCALGRAARPGLTAYPAPDPVPEEEEMLAAFERYATPLGYDPQTRTMEFTAVLDPGDRLSPADLLEMARYRDVGTAEGEAVETVVVTSPNRATAVAEAGPLRDLGARVQYLADDGSWRRLD